MFTHHAILLATVIIGNLAVAANPVSAAIDAAVYVFPVSDVVAGEWAQIGCRVTNTGTVAHNFGTGIEIRKGSSMVKDLGCQWTGTIQPGNSTNVYFGFTCPSDWEGTYTARAVAWSGWCGDGWLYSYDRNFQVIQPDPEASINVYSIDDVVGGESVEVDYKITNTGLIAHTFSVGGEIREGSSVLDDACKTGIYLQPDGYYYGSFTFDTDEDWDGCDYAGRCIAWSGSCGYGWLDSDDEGFCIDPPQQIAASINVASIDDVVAGQLVEADFTVTNMGDAAHSFGIGGEIWKGLDLLVGHPDLPNQTTPDITPGDTWDGVVRLYTK